MIKVGGLTPPPDFLELAERERRGEITTADIKKYLDKKYNVILRSKDMIDPYLYFGTSVLKNKLGIMEQSNLGIAEASYNIIYSIRIYAR